MAAIGSPAYLLVKELAWMLTPLTGSKETQVKNSAEFVGRIREKKPREGEIMISFDVVSLFTKVPIQEAM